MPAEWENPKAIMMAYPNRHTDWAYILEEAKRQFDDIINALIDAREFVVLIARKEDLGLEIRDRIEDNEGIVITSVPYNDTWTRDYGPITVEVSDGFGKKIEELDFGFNGWGLKFSADKDNLVNLNIFRIDNLREDTIFGLPGYRNQRDFVLEGGSIESDGKGTILTTSRCLCSPNRNGGKSKAEIEGVLRKLLGAERVLWLDHGFLEGDDTDSHIDTLARFAPEDTILYVAPPTDERDIHHHELKEMEKQIRAFRTIEGQPYRLIPLPFPEAIRDEEGSRLPATYANYLVTGWNLYLPTYGQPDNDRRAKEAVQKAFPEHRIYTVDCRTLIRQHGSLHCSTMQLYH